jgi:YVTN family beta-propeller protein
MRLKGSLPLARIVTLVLTVAIAGLSPPFLSPHGHANPMVRPISILDEQGSEPGEWTASLHRGAIAATLSHDAAESVGAVQQTLDLDNASLFAGNYRPLGCLGVQDAVVAVPLNRILVTCAQSNALMAFNATTGAYEGVVQVGSSPMGLAFDPDDDRVYVADLSGTVDVVAADSMTLLASISAGCSPIDVAYVNLSERIYVADSCSANVTVISTLNNSVIAHIGLGSDPDGLVYDAYNGDVYVTDPSDDRVFVVSAASDAILSSINLSAGANTFGGPDSIASDSITGTVYVVFDLTQRLDVISGSSGEWTANVSLQGYPSAVAVDPNADRIYVATDQLYVPTNNVTVIDASTLAAVSAIATGPAPTGIGVDSASGRVYVTDSEASDIAVIDESTSQVLGYFRSDTVPVGVAWDDVTQDVFVTNQGSGTLAQVNGSTNELMGSQSLSYGLTGVATDSSDGHLFVGSPDNDGVYDTSASGLARSFTSVGAGPVALAYDSTNGDIYAANSAANNVSVIDGATGSLVTSISLIPDGLIGGGLTDIAFDPNNGDLYVSVEGCTCSLPGNVTIIDGTTNHVVGEIDDWGVPGPSAVAVDIQNNELYAVDPAGFLSAFNATTDSLISTTSLGSAPEGIAIDSENGYIYVSNLLSDNVTVIDSSTNRAVGSIAVGMGPMGIAFDEANNNLYVANQNSGTLSVINSIRTSVTFTETGLPTGAIWNVTLGGALNWSGSSSISFIEPNGSYFYTVGTASGYEVSPTSGVLYVDGSNVTDALHFSSTEGAGATLLGLPVLEGAVVLLAAATVAAATTFVVISRHRRRTKPSAEPKPPSQEG